MAINLFEVITGIVIAKTCSIKADKDSADSKAINIKVNFEGATLRSVFDKAVSGAVIQWQNGVGRKNFDNYKHNQVVEILFKAPAVQTKSREEHITELTNSFRKAGLPEKQAIELATKAVDNPAVLS